MVRDFWIMLAAAWGPCAAPAPGCPGIARNGCPAGCPGLLTRHLLKIRILLNAGRNWCLTRCWPPRPAVSLAGTAPGLPGLLGLLRRILRIPGWPGMPGCPATGWLDLSWLWLWLRGLIGFRRLLYWLHLVDRLSRLLDLILFGFWLLRLRLGRFFYRSRDCTRSGKPGPPRTIRSLGLRERHVQRIGRRLCIGTLDCGSAGCDELAFCAEAVCEELGVCEEPGRIQAAAGSATGSGAAGWTSESVSCPGRTHMQQTPFLASQRDPNSGGAGSGYCEWSPDRPGFADKV